MKKNISILVAVIGVFAGRALASQGNTDMEVIILILAALPVLSFGVYVYKKRIPGSFLEEASYCLAAYPSSINWGTLEKFLMSCFLGHLALYFLRFVWLSVVCSPAAVKSHRTLYPGKNVNIVS